MHPAPPDFWPVSAMLDHWVTTLPGHLNLAPRASIQEPSTYAVLLHSSNSCIIATLYFKVS